MLYNKSYEKKVRELGVFNLKKRRLGGDFIILSNHLKGGCSKMEIGFFFKVTKTRENYFKLHQGRFRWDIRKYFSTERVIRH